jgi:uroporphyrinogen III methyltransferase/synthase
MRDDIQPPASGARHPVALVGAGPGDPALITVGGVARLAEADVVIYDRLANPALLRHARADALLIDAGKTPERHTLTQDEINALLVEHARAGKRVVRLKGGDPFVFGRGGEEAQALRVAGLPFEIIPGVSSAIAAPAYAGIPVTHRGIATSFAVITGHEDPTKDESGIDWPSVARGADTLIFLMGVGRLDEIAARLVEHGRDPSTAAAVVEWGTLPRQRVASGTLATIAASVRDAGIRPPAVTVVGEVASLRDGLRWYDNRPLSGKRVLVTRTRQQASVLSRALADAGAAALERPTIEIVEDADDAAVADAIGTLGTSAYGWVVFTSANAIDIFLRHLHEAGLDARAFRRAQIACVGPGTAAALEARGLRADLVPERYVAEGLLDAFATRVMRGQRVLLPRARGARDVLIDGLQAMGARIDELPLYRAAVPASPDAEGLRRLRAGEIDIVTFASSSAVRNLIEMLENSRQQTGDNRTPADVLRGAAIAAIGPVTAAAVRDAGLEVAVEASEYTIEGLVRALVDASGRS